MMQWTAAHRIVPIVCVIAIAGAALYSVFAPAPRAAELEAVVGEEIVIEGVVVRDPDQREKTTHLTISVEKIAGITIYGNPRVLVYADRFADIAYGDRVKVTGTLQKPEPFETDNERTFDYPKYLLAHGITHTVSLPSIEVIEHGKGNPVVSSLVFLKHALLRGINKALPEPESALLAGLLIGEKQSLGEKLTEAFRNAGVVHIIVLSGYNVALVINAVLFIVNSFLPRVAALTVGGIAVVGFAVMTGASETTIRASAMALIVLLARFLHRPTEGVRVLLLVAAGMALWNPYLVLFDLSYQLSILATLGLILFSDFFASTMPFIPKKFGLREILATTVATQLTVLPLLILSVGSVSIVALFANALILPAVPLAMLAGFVAALVALVSWTVAFPFALAAYMTLHYIVTVAVLWGTLPFSAVPVSKEWTWPLLTILAAAYAAAIYVYQKKKTSR